MAATTRRKQHEQWLCEVTALPTAAGHEHRVIDFIEQWVSRRKGLRLRRDRAGNLLITQSGRSSKQRPTYLTAHLDHPAFVVVDATNRTTIELEFRGGVRDPYFDEAAIEIFDENDTAHPARVIRLDAKAKPFKRVTARLVNPTASLRVGDIGRWRFLGRGATPTIHDGMLHTPACDDLAAVAAALATLDVVRKRRGCGNVGILFTLAEEIGFIGAIAACKLKTVSKRSRLICLENSRSFPESPIGAGPILRVGDRISVFDPVLTNRLTDLQLAYQQDNPEFRAQRKLMPGGACEATVFAEYGYESTCVCLPLGNYHNMADIDGVLAGKRPARVAPECIAVEDYHGLIELLTHFVTVLDSAKVPPLRAKLDGFLDDRGYVVGMG